MNWEYCPISRCRCAYLHSGTDWSFLIMNALPVQGCSPECVFIPLGHFGALETELLVFQADFLSKGTLRTGTALVFADAHETLPGNTEEFLSSL
jgi:hypothetical protein